MIYTHVMENRRHEYARRWMYRFRPCTVLQRDSLSRASPRSSFAGYPRRLRSRKFRRLAEDSAPPGRAQLAKPIDFGGVGP